MKTTVSNGTMDAGLSGQFLAQSLSISSLCVVVWELRKSTYNFFEINLTTTIVITLDQEVSFSNGLSFYGILTIFNCSSSTFGTELHGSPQSILSLH